MDDDVHMLVRVSLRQPNERHEVCLDVGRSGSVATVATSYSPSPCHNLLFFAMVISPDLRILCVRTAS